MSNELSKRFRVQIVYDGTNRIQELEGRGDDFFECFDSLLDDIEDFIDQYENNNFENGGNTAFTSDAKELYNNIDFYIQEVMQFLLPKYENLTVNRQALLNLARDLEVSVMDSGACGDVVGMIMDIVKQIRIACGIEGDR